MQFQKIISIIDDIIDGDDPDPTGGALYYENPSSSRSKWFETEVRNKMKHKVSIGRHSFWGPK